MGNNFCRCRDKEKISSSFSVFRSSLFSIVSLVCLVENKLLKDAVLGFLGLKVVGATIDKESEGSDIKTYMENRKFHLRKSKKK